MIIQQLLEENTLFRKELNKVISDYSAMLSKFEQYVADTEKELEELKAEKADLLNQLIESLKLNMKKTEALIDYEMEKVFRQKNFWATI